MTEPAKNFSPGGDEEKLTERLRAELVRLHTPPAMSEGKSDEILAAMRKEGERRKVNSLGWSVWRAGIAAAVLVAIGVGVWFLVEGGKRSPGTYVRTGDIRDAFYLARQLRDHAPPQPTGAWDSNHDGALDEKDVQTLALAAVQIKPVGGAGQ